MLSHIWYTNRSSSQKVDEYDDQATGILHGPDKSEYVDYQNGTRAGPIEYRLKITFFNDEFGQGIIIKRAILQSYYITTR